MMRDIAVDTVFIGSCAIRLEDLRAAADVVRGRKVKGRMRALVVPGSMEGGDAEGRGLGTVFTAARFGGGRWGARYARR